MKIRVLFLLVAVCLSNLSFGKDKKLKVYLEENQFYTPDGGNYLETHLQFVGSTLYYVQKDSSLVAEVEINQSILIGDSVITTDHYLLQSPHVIDSVYGDFHDIQRYALSPGNYTYQLSVRDVNSTEAPLKVSKSITILDLSHTLCFSPILPALSIYANPKKHNIFTRMGYDVVPKLGNYYPTEAQNLLYYVEVYNTQSQIVNDSIYVIKQQVIGDSGKALPNYTRYYRYKTTPLQPIPKSVDISELPSGSYTLKLEVINRKEDVLATQIMPFDRTNNALNNNVDYASTVIDPAFVASIPKDSTAYYVASLIPIAHHAEIKNIIRLLKKKDSTLNIKYLQAFWKNTSPTDPYESWIKYKQQVKLVERLYASNYQVGFETDRGRVYLEYGSPSSIIQRPSSPSEYPYEIWEYDKIKQYSKRRFVFYSPNGIGTEYKLLHSDMVGELHNYRWRYVLNKRNSPGGNGFDDPTGGTPNYFGQHAWEDYNTY